MRIPRIYQDTRLSPGLTIEADPRARRYLTRVLRLQAGDDLVLFNGRGDACRATLARCERNSSHLELGAMLEENPESPLTIHLGLGISRGERMDIALQKAVELGVNDITPLFTRRSMVKLDASRREKRLEHWQGIIISACEQCGRNRLPALHPPMENEVWIGRDLGQLKLTLDPAAGRTLHDIQPAPQAVCLYIGPEGGLSDEEIEQAGQQGFQGIRLGPRVLRTETAVIAALTAVQLQWGDLA